MPTVNDSELAVVSRKTSLVDVLDRVLDKGVVVDGDIELTVAGIQLVYLQLKLLLSSSATLERCTPALDQLREECAGGHCRRPIARPAGYLPETFTEPVPLPTEAKEPEGLRARVLKDDESAPCLDQQPRGKIDIDPKKVEQGLAKLVLTLVELIRQLMEKQALRRVDQGSLNDKQIDALGEAFMRLNEKVQELKKVFGLEDDDLNLNLGPLGDLT